MSQTDVSHKVKDLSVFLYRSFEGWGDVIGTLEHSCVRLWGLKADHY